MTTVFLSNTRLKPAVNWTLLGEPMRRAMADRGAAVVSPSPGPVAAVLGDRLARPRSVRRGSDVFWMQLSSRPEWEIVGLAASAVGRRRSAYVVDAWPYVHAKIATFSRVMRLDPCFIAFRESYELLSAAYPSRHFAHLPFGFDDDVFRPDTATTRDIFALWMGRRHDPLHRAIAAYCEERGLEYVAPQGGSIADPRDLGALAARARYFVVTPPDLDHPERSGGLSPLVMRYLEGLGSGCRLLGTLPRSGEFEASFPREAILEVASDGSDLAERLDRDRDEHAGWTASAEAEQLAHASHTWRNRADDVLRVLDGGRSQ